MFHSLQFQIRAQFLPQCQCMAMLVKQLNCSVVCSKALPGQYYATWLNGTRRLYIYPAPSQWLADPSSEMTIGLHYSVDPSDLSPMLDLEMHYRYVSYTVN